MKFTNGSASASATRNTNDAAIAVRWCHPWGITLKNEYRWCAERAEWQFYDGVGPWAPSANMAMFDHVRGTAHLIRTGYSPMPEEDNRHG